MTMWKCRQALYELNTAGVSDIGGRRVDLLGQSSLAKAGGLAA
jgi:hypothetical protein